MEGINKKVIWLDGVLHIDCCSSQNVARMTMDDGWTTNCCCLQMVSGSEAEDLADYLQRMNKKLEEMAAQHLQVSATT